MLDWLDHHAPAVMATVQVLTWSCLVFSHYRLKGLINRLHRVMSGKALNSGERGVGKEG